MLSDHDFFVRAAMGLVCLMLALGYVWTSYVAHRVAIEAKALPAESLSQMKCDKHIDYYFQGKDGHWECNFIKEK